MLGPLGSPNTVISVQRFDRSDDLARLRRHTTLTYDGYRDECELELCFAVTASGRDEGLGPVVFDVDGLRFGVLVCEDAWFDEPAQAARAAGAQVLCVLNASPFHIDKAEEREQRMAERARTARCPLLYSHLVGGQDEVVFDGASFAVDGRGEVRARAPSFADALLVLEVHADGAVTGPVAPLPTPEAQAWAALVTGVRDYLGKNGFPGAIIGLSGGIDSALVLAIAVDALGADKVRAVMMPSPYTADISWIDARDMARRLGVRYDEIAIAPMFDAFRASLAGQFAGSLLIDQYGHVGLPVSPISVKKLVGVGLIVVGVVCVATARRAAPALPEVPTPAEGN